MEYDECPLYDLKSKRTLRHFLGAKDSLLLKQDYVASFIRPYIDTDADGKRRLIEPPDKQIKTIQTRIKVMLSKIHVPDNVFSGIRGRSYVDNARKHQGQRHLYKIDLTAFFPSITRETVYTFFRADLRCSFDVAEALTNLTTLEISRSSAKHLDDVYRFLDDKRIKVTNHLISGSPASQILSYLANHRMFDELQTLAARNHTAMTVYVDDITFSSCSHISHWFRGKVRQIVTKYGYRISDKKVKGYSKLYPKLVTGAVIDPSGSLIIRNSLRYRIIAELDHLRRNPADSSRNRLRGLITAARQIEAGVFPSIHRFASEKLQPPSN